MLHCQNIDLHIILGRSVLVCSSSANLRSSFGFYLSAIRQQKKISSKPANMADKPGCSTNVNKTQRTSTNASKVKRSRINFCAPYCTNNSLRKSGISFHKIPKDEALQKNG